MMSLKKMAEEGWEYNGCTPIYGSDGELIVGTIIVLIKKNPEYWDLLEKEEDTSGCPPYFFHEEEWYF